MLQAPYTVSWHNKTEHNLTLFSISVIVKCLTLEISSQMSIHFDLI